MNTVQEYITSLEKQFRALSKSRKNALRRQAAQEIERFPGSADHSTFWRGLSARQVLSIL